jgi:hypothetical protein
MQYDFDIKHIAGAKNIVSDHLSRLVQNHTVNNKHLSPDNQPTT